MQELRIALLTINDVKDFVTLTNYCSFDVDLISGRYTVDAKSLMGIFSIIPSDTLLCKVYAEITECGEFLEKIDRFIVKA